MTISLWFTALAAAAAVVLPSNSQSLCGRDYATIQQLSRELQADKDVTRFPSRNGVATFFDRKSMTLWWLHSRRGSIAVVTCRRKIATDSGYVDGRVEADCNGDRTGLCTAQAQRMARVKF